jgi:tetraacyldisaccharide-1-P 4'-kinase
VQNVVTTKAFPDHYHYSRGDIENIMSIAQKNNLRIITTRKDYVKLRWPIMIKPTPNLLLALEFVGITPKDYTQNDLLLSYLEVELKIKNEKKFFDSIFARYRASKYHA